MGQQQYDNTNKGSLFKNDRKQRDNQPDFTGKIELGQDVIDAALAGLPIYVSGWTKEIKQGQKAGQKFISLAVQPPRDQSQGQQQQQRGPAQSQQRQTNQQRPQQQRPAQQNQEFKEDDIPF
jgi:CHASE1-domain containing sensor protein